MTETEDIKVRLWAIVVCGCRCVPVCVYLFDCCCESLLYTSILWHLSVLYVRM